LHGRLDVQLAGFLTWTRKQFLHHAAIVSEYFTVLRRFTQDISGSSIMQNTLRLNPRPAFRTVIGALGFEALAALFILPALLPLSGTGLSVAGAVVAGLVLVAGVVGLSARWLKGPEARRRRPSSARRATAGS
jgi:hypothetical protein